MIMIITKTWTWKSLKALYIEHVIHDNDYHKNMDVEKF